MSIRKVKDPVTKSKSELVTTTNKSAAHSSSNQKYFKRNYLDVLKIITPNIYFNDDTDLSGTEVPATSQLINSHVLAANSSEVISVSALAGNTSLSAVNTFAGISKFFVKQNKLTYLTPSKFELDILKKLGKSYSSFNSSSDFLNYLSATFLPTIVLQRTDAEASNNLATNTASAFDNTSSGTHKYLIDNLAWLYFLNTSDPAQANVRPSTYATSAELAKMMTAKLWNGEIVTTKDSLKVFQKYLWGNYVSLSSVSNNIIPAKYRVVGAGAYTSGVQHRNRLENLVDIVYSDHYFNRSDTKVKTSFEDYISTTSLITDTESAGPLSRLLEAFAFSLADRGTEIQELETLVDIDSCPDEFLPYLADLIGWTLIGPDASRHRNQLRQAVSIYKAKGTKRSVQAMTDAVFGGSSTFNVTSGSLFDLWESYVPNLIFYTIATSSTLTKNGQQSFPRETAAILGLDTYVPNNLEVNIKLIVDRIMWELINEFPNNFKFAGKVFPRVKFYFENDPEEEYVGEWTRQSDGKYYTGRDGEEIIPTQNPDFIFKYRDRVMPIPPWENTKYYTNCEISVALINALKKKLECFGVDEVAAARVGKYILDNTIENDNVSFYSNSFLFFTTSEKIPFNYEQVINVSRPKGADILKYLPYWSAKSSHFKITFSASSFDFASDVLDYKSKYALTRIKDIVNTVSPAHAIPDIVLDVSSVEDIRIDLSGLSTQKADVDLSSAATYGSSATILTNFAVSTVNPRNTSVLPAAKQTVFRREDADALDDPLFASGDSDVYFSSAPRNAIRRKNYKYLMDSVNYRDGVGSAGYDWLFRTQQLPGFYSGDALKFTTSGEFSLGYIPSTLSFAPVALVRAPNNNGNLIDRVNLDAVWFGCQTYDSSDSFYAIEVSNTFPLRGLSAVDSSSVSSFFEARGDVSRIQILQHRVKEKSYTHEASSIVSGLFNDVGTINTLWPVSSSKVMPTTLSSWYIDPSRDVINSMANQLHENDISVIDTNYLRDFSFGKNLHLLYRDWLTNYGRETINLNSKYTRADEILSHTFGPYIFNSEFEITASSIDDVAPQIVTSSLEGEASIDIGWNQGQGILSEGNVFGITNVIASDSASMYVASPEVRNDTLLSGVEFVDTSNPYWTPQQPSPQPNAVFPSTFNLIRLNKLSFNYDTDYAAVPKWMRASKLEDNLLIKYRRSFVTALPRLRYKIDPTSGRPDIKNFFVPDCDYSLNIECANIRTDELLGGSILKAWVHTEPIDYTYRLPNGTYTTESSVWSYSNGIWVRAKVSDINSSLGIDIVQGLSPGTLIEERYPTVAEGPAPAPPGTNRRSVTGGEVINPYNNLNPRIGCVDSVNLLETGDSIMQSAEIFDTVTIDFNTKNRNVGERLKNKIHTKDRKYYVEIFLAQASLDSFIVFDKISIQNKTFKDKAYIPTKFYKCDLDRKELKTCFDYFTSLATSRLASRNAVTSSGSMEANGGSRLSYRDNIKREINTLGAANFAQLISLTIRGN